MSAQPNSIPETVVLAEPVTQAGEPVLAGACPRCGVTFGMSGGEGKAFCSCGTLLKFVDKTKQ